VTENTSVESQHHHGAPDRFATRTRSQVRTANAAHESRDDGEPRAESVVSEVARSRFPIWPRRPSMRDRSRWARRAPDWPLVNYLAGAVWLGVAVTLGVSYYGSYDNLVDVLTALGYAAGPAHVVPVALDAPLTASVIGQFLLARWKSPAVRRWRLFAVTV